MTFVIDPEMHWADHFVKYGFAVLRNQVSQEFTEKALERVRLHVEGEGKDLPFDEWTVKNVGKSAHVVRDSFLDTIFDQPNIRHIINTMYGTAEVGAPDGWSGNPNYQIFVAPFDPDHKPQPFHGGHIDFGGNLIPIFGNAFVIQVALRDTEPFGGNITVIPGSHKLVQQRAMVDPYTQYPYDFDDFEFEEPYEFVAKAGDVLLMQHLMFHSGNRCAGATHRPRIALHLQAERTNFLTSADPDDPNICPWAKSFTLNGKYDDPNDQQRYLDFCESKKAMWGYWTSEDGQTEYKVYTWADGALRATIRRGDAKQISIGARFDGRRMTFQQSLDAPAQQNGASGNGSAPGERSQARTTLEHSLADPERMVCTIQPEVGGEPVTINLKRTQVITTRLIGEQ